MAGQRPGLAWLAGWAVILRRAAGDPAGAAALARRVGIASTTPTPTRRRLAELAWAIGASPAAAAISEALGDDDDPSLAVMRAHLAQADGRYRDALALLDGAEGRGRPDADALAARLRGELAILEPAWRPDPGEAGRRLASAWSGGIPGRVLHVVTVSEPYRLAGYTVRTHDVVRAQQAVGLDAHVVTQAGFPERELARDAPADEVVAGVPYHRLRPGETAGLTRDAAAGVGARAAADLVARLRPAVLHAHSNHVPARLALAVARPIGIPVVYEVRGFWEESWAAKRGLDEVTAVGNDRYRGERAAETAAILEADAIVTLSETMRAELEGRGCPPERITVVPNAVDVERFVPGPRDPDLAGRLGIDPADQVIGYVTTLNVYEGLPTLLAAAARLRSAGRRLRLLLVGDGPEHTAVLADAARLGLDDGTLVLPGRLAHDGIAAAYGLIDVFVVPRTPDRVSRLVTPLKPLEAMAMARAVVVSDLPALRELVEPGVTGRAFRPGDAEDLARVVGELLDDPVERDRLGREGRAWVERERTWAQNGARYRALYERLGVV